MSSGKYNVPFLHLNVKRLPLVETRGCFAAILEPALSVWAETAQESEEKPSVPPWQLPTELSTYCCTQFVVARARLRHAPLAFWRVVWQSLEQRVEVGSDGGDLSVDDAS